MTAPREPRQWYLDGEKVDFKTIIKKGQECGYEGNGGIFQTSMACQYLEKAGHKVELKEEQRQEKEN